LRYMFSPNLNLYPDPLLDVVNYATGADYTQDSLLETGERIFNLERLFLLEAGFTKADDTLPKRMLEEPMPEGPAKGQVVELAQMLEEFYELRGWDQHGVPTPDKLEQLGI